MTPSRLGSGDALIVECVRASTSNDDLNEEAIVLAKAKPLFLFII